LAIPARSVNRKKQSIRLYFTFGVTYLLGLLKKSGKQA
jgi:hypothetical protein